MRYNKYKTLTILVIALGLMLTASCGKGKYIGMIIVSETPSDPAQRNFLTGDSWRYLPGSKIIAIDPDSPAGKPEVLTGDFYSACNPEISPDGKLMAFSAQLKEGDTWQIWILDLTNSKKTQVTKQSGPCTDPAFLPPNRLVFSGAFTNDSLKSHHSLFTCTTDGSDLRRITFSPHQWFASHILSDGRILALGRQVFPEIKKLQYMVLRPDGTKADLFYVPGGKNSLISRPRETGNGTIVFVESSEIDPSLGSLVSISYNRPLHSRVNLSKGMEGEFLSVSPEKSGRFLVSYRKSSTDKYELREFDPGTGGISRTIYSDPGYDVVEAVIAEPYARPKILPSEVDMKVKSGLIMCQDINVIDRGLKANLSSPPDFKRIEIVGLDSSMGIVEAAKDRSFYLKVKADTPFRLRLLDDKGNAVNEPCDWIWLRPNERRGCVGCHEDPEIAPDNRIPLAVKSSPVAVPVHIVKMKEKSVELE